MSDQIFQFRVLFSGPYSTVAAPSGSSHLARDDFQFDAVASYCSLLRSHIVSPVSDSGCRSAAVRYALTERGRIESTLSLFSDCRRREGEEIGEEKNRWLPFASFASSSAYFSPLQRRRYWSL